MSSKVVLLLGLVVVLVISWEVAASETTKEEKTQKATGTNGGVGEAKYGGYPGGGYPGGGGYGGYPGHGGNGGYPGRGGYGGGHCRYGCCGGGGYHGGGCRRCCSYLGEAPDAETEAKPQN
ncbi:PREDICTED: glycine-rich cell wall structural protein-like [Nelumbo nucifera]|uniref:Glycine-rich cell wall structural protein-like n=1 Tax=Nelumbo nucifera TaxID=4432 RepID=A0A1U8B363_NELNU|nr:PREDICTED: glycine-rich cell wall structural protein-like [Nelumbo nucifera]